MLQKYNIVELLNSQNQKQNIFANRLSTSSKDVETYDVKLSFFLDIHTFMIIIEMSQQ